MCDLHGIRPGYWCNGRLDFIRTDPSHWDIKIANTDHVVGQIRFNVIWNEFTLVTVAGEIFAFDCLEDISTLLRHLNSKTK
jgi:hypothetical protein